MRDEETDVMAHSDPKIELAVLTSKAIFQRVHEAVKRNRAAKLAEAAAPTTEPQVTFTGGTDKVVADLFLYLDGESS